MPILSDKNLSRYKTYLDELKTQVHLWPKYLSDAETQITSSVGTTFKTEYAKGKKACENIQNIIKILRDLEKSLNTLILDADIFYTTSYNASKK